MTEITQVKLDEMFAALQLARDAIDTLPPYALGGVSHDDPHTGEYAGQHPIKDEVLARIDEALASQALRSQGEAVDLASPAAADLRHMMSEDERKRFVEPIVGGPEGESIIGYKLKGGYWSMLQARLRNLLDTHPAPQEAGDVKATHRHKKRGSEYVLIGIGKMQAEHWLVERRAEDGCLQRAMADMEEVAIYRSATDPTEIWVRPREEFEDGRFEVLSTLTEGSSR